MKEKMKAWKVKMKKKSCDGELYMCVMMIKALGVMCMIFYYKLLYICAKNLLQISEVHIFPRPENFQVVGLGSERFQVAFGSLDRG